jgi:cell division protein FtsZ
MRPDNLFENQAVIKVIGIGGAGGNAINRMIEEGVMGVKFITMNSDAQALNLSLAPTKIQIGDVSTKGLGAGGDPTVGETAAVESRDKIMAELDGCDMVFITAGMGGGTGTGAAPVVAEMARRLGILTVGVVTKPFLFEGPRRRRLAEEGAAKLKANVDTLVTVPNDRLLSVVEKKTTMQQAFAAADDILRQGVQGISDIILLPGLINVDFADVRSVMSNAGVALMGLGRASGEDRAQVAAQMAAHSPLLETSINGAKRLLINITAGPDFCIGEAHDAMEYLMQYADKQDADVIMGHVMKDVADDGEVMITLLAAGMEPNTKLPPKDTGVFYTRPEAVAPVQSPTTQTIVPSAPVTPPAPKAELDEIDLDIPTFLRRQKGT